DRRRHGETAAAVLLRDQRGEKSRLGQGLDELGRIGPFAIDLAPVLAGKFRAQRPHRLPDGRQLSLVGGTRIHALISARPLLIAMILRSGTSARKLTTLPSRQISVRIVSP